MTRTTLAAALVLAASAAQAFDRETTDALRTCHDHLWEVTDYADLPNAAMYVFPLSSNDGTVVVAWHILWDDPRTRGAGTCTVTGGAVEAFEDYTREAS